MWKKRLTFMLIFLLIGFLGAIGIVKLNQFKDKSLFTKEKWIREPGKRYLIVENMLKKYDLEKMTKEKVIQLLGKPEEKFEGGMILESLNKNPINPSGPNNIFYFTKKGLMPEEVSGLYIMFDNKGKVNDYTIVHFTT
ncbi:hypothetical protein LGL55_24085 [Clostridium tagluense]|uniref:hypothetical protein n=1 Tax=Clostridium tagluense TaxID=360422 RepID=UPI001C0C7A17|nr:hypothetical protein [Clostridium tagluense]MBU3129438.1 hypothetical protein [Clostridium tagluense]MBW9156097.1 hypothetical protein [Clostridium tagluense]MCB2297886.1 hypothetical protein [Clostridium tagluense]MCB2314127.1 hypothetical protein [Clostridium tagluense]MCB2318969.1 hypothetical protein [Clostridium tagluense]